MKVIVCYWGKGDGIFGIDGGDGCGIPLVRGWLLSF